MKEFSNFLAGTYRGEEQSVQSIKQFTFVHGKVGFTCKTKDKKPFSLI